MLQGPPGSTPFSVKDILNLEQSQLNCPPKENSGCFSDARQCHDLNYLVTKPPCTSSEQGRSTFNFDPNPVSYISGSINLTEQISSTESYPVDSRRGDTNKPDQVCPQYHNMAASTLFNNSKFTITDEVKEESNRATVPTPTQAAASTLLDFSQHLHNQTPDKSWKQPGLYADYFPDLYNLDYSQYNKIHEASLVDDSRQLSQPFNESTVNRHGINSPGFRHPVVTTLQTTNSMILGEDFEGFVTSTDGTQLNAPSSSASFQNQSDLECFNKYSVNVFDNKPTSNSKQIDSEKQSNDSSSSSYTPNTSSHHNAFDNQASPQRSQNPDKIEESHHIMGELTFDVFII